MHVFGIEKSSSKIVKQKYPLNQIVYIDRALSERNAVGHRYRSMTTRNVPVKWNCYPSLFHKAKIG